MGKKAGLWFQVQVEAARGWGRQIHHAPLPILGLRALCLLPTVLPQPLIGYRERRRRQPQRLRKSLPQGLAEG